MSPSQTQSASQSNVSADLIAEALAIYTQDKAAHDRTGMTIARHQAHYEKMGITSVLVRQMFQEAKLSSEERVELYADEHRYRRAVSLWEADTEEDFDRAMMQAAQTEIAAGEGAERLNAARAYNDGFNGGLKGGQSATDNPHQPGTVKHAQWSKGVKDGAKQANALGFSRPAAAKEPESDAAPVAATATPTTAAKPAAPKGANGKRGRGRPAKKKAAVATSSDDKTPESGESVRLFPPAMPD